MADITWMMRLLKHSKSLLTLEVLSFGSNTKPKGPGVASGEELRHSTRVSSASTGSRRPLFQLTVSMYATWPEAHSIS